MFQKTRVKLTMLNASVLFIILVVLGAAMYIYLRTTIIGQIDRAIDERSSFFSAPVLEAAPGFMISGVAAQRLTTSRVAITGIAGTITRNVETLLWNEDGKLLNELSAERYPPELLLQLGRLLPESEAVTVRQGGEAYRVLSIQAPERNPLEASSTVFRSEVQYYQVVTNISSEMNMLNTLLLFIAAGIVLGGGISVLAGLYLANRALVPIRSSWDKQQQFVADASHELRTPLAVLQTHTELLLRHPDHTIEQESRELSTILKEIRRMKKLVNGLLTLSQSDADKMELHMKPVPVDRIAERVLQQFAPLASLKNSSLTWRLDENAVINGDEERLQQLLVIIIDNAIKYTPECGSIHLSCKKAAGMVVVEIRDNGIGVPAQDLPHLFERFYRGDKMRGRSEGGSGLGLAIARWIVARHNGKIEASSEPNQGLTMTVSLPA